MIVDRDKKDTSLSRNVVRNNVFGVLIFHIFDTWNYWVSSLHFVHEQCSEHISLFSLLLRENRVATLIIYGRSTLFSVQTFESSGKFLSTVALQHLIYVSVPLEQADKLERKLCTNQ